MSVSLLRPLVVCLSWCSIRKLRWLSIGVFLVACLFHAGNAGSLCLGRPVPSRLAYGFGGCPFRSASLSIVVERNKGCFGIKPLYFVAQCVLLCKVRVFPISFCRCSFEMLIVVGFALAFCLRIKPLWLRLGGYTLLAFTLVTFESMRGFLPLVRV